MTASTIALHLRPTPAGLAVLTMLEECGLPYTLSTEDHACDEPWPAADAEPSAPPPTLVDADGQAVALSEAATILLYLADKTGRWMPSAPSGRYAVLQWLMFQQGSLGPVLAQARHFRHEAPAPVAYAIERYTLEARRLYATMERQLSEHAFIAGPDYSVADIAIFPWLRGWREQGILWAEHPRVHAWFERIAVRPAVQRSLRIAAPRPAP
jgi:GST-like protein